MDFFSAMNISASGLAAERTRVDAAASNLANADATRGPDGKPYKRIDPILASRPFENDMNATTVEVMGMAQSESPGRKVYSPGHPDADGDGFVTLPDVNPIHETVNLISASKAYDANASAIETLKTMAQRALDIAK
jgi:flagellar basal-body rod protein FlgC